MSAAGIVRRFLPDADERLGPLGLLGLTASACDEASIAAALNRQLARVAAHPQGQTPDADEVRLVLHVAAAQLRDPANRAALLSPVPAAGPRRPSPASVAFEDLALQVIVHSGGWNQDAKRRLGAMAHAYGLGAPELRSAVMAVARRRGAPRRTPAAKPLTRATIPAAPPVELERASTTGRWGMVIATIVLLIITGWMAMRLDRLVRGPRLPTQALSGGVASQSPGAPATPPGAAPDKAATPPPSEEVAPPVTVQQPADPSADPASAGRAVLMQLRTASAQLTNDPRSALASFTEAVATLSRTWTTLDAELITATAAESAEFIFAASRRDRASGRAALDAVLTPVQNAAVADRTLADDQLHAVAWCGGMLQRLRRDRDLPEAFADTIDATLRRLGDDRRPPNEPSLWRGAAFALESMGRRLLPREGDPTPPDALLSAWSTWTKVAAAFTKGDAPALSKSLVLDIAEAILRGGPDPTLDKLTSDVLAVLLGAVEWRDEAVTGARLIAWFDDATLETQRLAAAANWLVVNAAVPGLTQAMMVPVDAAGVRRAQLRDQWATLLGQPASRDAQAAVSRWHDQARAMLALPLSETDSDAALLRAVGLARLNEAAALRWRQDAAAADRAADNARLDSISASLRAASAQEKSEADPSRLTWPGTDPDGAWAKRYLAAMNSADLRIELLNELRNSSGPIGPADADVLAEAACYGTPVEVRRLAQSTVRERGGNLLIVNALLEAAPRASRNASVTEMIEAVTGEQLPTLDDARWRPEVRRALVEHALRIIAAARDPAIDQLAQMLSDAYRARIGLSSGMPLPVRDRPPSPADAPPADAVTRAPDPAGPESAAAELWESWASLGRRYAEGGWTFISMQELERRRAGRASLAEGPLQLFAAEQASSAEVMAYVVAAERPSRATVAADIVRQMSEQRRKAQHVFNQIESAEAAMLRLWIIRFGEDEGATP